jgi:hypothetical protein
MTRKKLDPTPEEIQQLCREVRRTWDRRERWKRSGKPRPKPWIVPFVRVGEIMAAVSASREGQEMEGTQ